MTLLIPDLGERTLLDWALEEGPEDQVLKLYTSNTTPAEGDTSATYTEAAGAGYAAKTLTRATWNAAATVTGTTSKSYPQQVWTFTGTLGPVYGYFVEGATAGELLWAERTFPSGQTFENGWQLKVTVKIELD